jgi:hypothetical protein
MNNWELTLEEQNKLTEKDRKKYETAVAYKKHDWACGPWGGWVRGNDLLKELGWTEQTRTEGHRQFVSLVKPQM